MNGRPSLAVRRVLAFAALMLVVHNQSAAQSPAAPYPLPGQLIDLGGYRVHLYCTGQGSPTVMIVGAGFSFDWDLVQPEVAKFTKVCTYDVSGTAWSDHGPPLTCSERIDEVHKLLDKAKLEGPYVFVGLSIGALVARVYASQYPGEVAGMVMVDHAFIDVGAPSSSLPATPGLDSPPVLIYKEPIVLTVEDTTDFAKLPERMQRLHRWAASLKPVPATVETAEDCLFLLKRASRDPHPLGEMPLAVVSTSNQQPNYKKLQTELLSFSTHGKQFIADRSFHSVEIDQPEVVIDAIRQVVEMVRK
jgi:pimeloyl-ACP methyl ester carboxylesterase